MQKGIIQGKIQLRIQERLSLTLEFGKFWITGLDATLPMGNLAFRFLPKRQPQALEIF